MKNPIQIDLSQPYEQVVASLRSLPRTANRQDRLPESELRRIVRSLYEAANGRQVETSLGFLPIAPPVAEFLKAMPFNVTSQMDFLIAAAARIISGPNHLAEERAERKELPLFPSNNKETQVDRAMSTQTQRAESVERKRAMWRPSLELAH